MSEKGNLFGISLRDLVKREGGNEPFNRFETPRHEIIHQVREGYRPARALLLSSDTEKQAMGRAIMRGFITVMDVMHGLFSGLEKGEEQELLWDQDMPAAWLVHHNMASAMHLLGKHHEADVINQRILDEIEEQTDNGSMELDEDTKFIRLKIFFGLVENNELFRDYVEVESWGAKLQEMRELRLPDYPGRVQAYVEYMLKHELMTLREACEMVSYTIMICFHGVGFGKQDQIERLKTFYQEIEDRKHERPTT